MTNEEVFERCWAALMSGINLADEFPRPLLAHDCSIATLESILGNKQLWLSNPLFMNDLEEVRFGVDTGMRLVLSSSALKDATGDADRANVFFEAIEYQFQKFAHEHSFDIYVACFSELTAHENDDGRLSMWRAYGANGDGAALVFDVNSVSNPQTVYNGILIGRVQYGTTLERETWLDSRVQETAKFIAEQDIPTTQLPLVAAALFERIKIMAIFAKHRGFAEEKEWRMVYTHEHARASRFEAYLGYHLTARGIEPKLKLPIHGEAPWHEPGLDINVLKRPALSLKTNSKAGRKRYA